MRPLAQFQPHRPDPDETSPDAPRCEISTKTVHLLGYPSAPHVGLVALEGTCAADFDFLDLDPVDPPATRLASQDQEDDFCKKLLRLGARPWPTLERFRNAMGAIDNDSLFLDLMRDGPDGGGGMARLTAEELRWVSVAWPSSGGGVWVSDLTRTYELDSRLVSEIGDHDLFLEAGRLRLAGDMDVKSRILQAHFKGKFYENVNDVPGLSLQLKGELNPPEQEH